MATRRFLVVIEEAGDNLSAYVPDLPGCVANGKTPEEVERNMQEALEMHLQGMVEDHIEIPAPNARSGYFSVPSLNHPSNAAGTE